MDTRPNSTSCSKDRCGRPSVIENNGQSLCHMHSPDPEKDLTAFRAEIVRLLDAAGGEGALTIDFDDFHFPRGFRFPTDTEFPKRADFNAATFHGLCEVVNCYFPAGADFTDAVFLDGSDFARTLFDEPGVFRGANFHGKTNFSMTHFNGAGNFCSAVFHGAAYFSGTTFAGSGLFRNTLFKDSAKFTSCVFHEQCIYERLSGFDLPKEWPSRVSIADFRWVHFEQPKQVTFARINRGDVRSPSRRNAEMEDYPGVRLQVQGARLSEVTFEDINWYTTAGRVTLWDEEDVRSRSGLVYNTLRRLRRLADLAPIPRTTDYESVAIAYRELMKSFDATSATELAEDCYVGAMEMARIDPSRPRFQRMVLAVYRAISNYGSSYRRAFFVLLAMLLAFGFAYALPQSGLRDPSGGAMVSFSEGRVVRGLVHSIEVGSFQREKASITTTRFGRLLTIGESILVPSQLALFLLALRRRLKR